MVKYLIVICAVALLALWLLFKIARKLFKVWLIIMLLIAPGQRITSGASRNATPESPPPLAVQARRVTAEDSPAC